MALAPGSLTRPGRLGTLEKTTLTRGKSVDKSQVITLLETTKRTGPESRQLYHLLCDLAQLLKSFVPQFPYDYEKRAAGGGG